MRRTKKEDEIEEAIETEQPIEEAAAADDDTPKARGAQPANDNGAFWERPDVQQAQRLIDLWASQRKHMDEGCEGVIRSELVFEAKIQTFEIFERGLTWVYEEYRKSHTDLTIKTNALPPTMSAMLLVSAVMVHLDLCPDRAKGVISVTEALLLWLYPRTGPYEVNTSNTHRSFNPPGFAGRLNSKYFDRAKENFLRQIERDFLRALVDANHAPQRFFERHSVENTAFSAFMSEFQAYVVPTARELEQVEELRRAKQ